VVAAVAVDAVVVAAAVAVAVAEVAARLGVIAASAEVRRSSLRNSNQDLLAGLDKSTRPIHVYALVAGSIATGRGRAAWISNQIEKC
jgi:hypothetical protein